MTGLDIGVGLSVGLERGVQNFFQAMQYVKQNKMQMEKDDIAIKVAKLQLKGEEYENDPETIAKKKEKLDAEIKAIKVMNTLRSVQAKQILSKTKRNLEDFSGGIKLLGALEEKYPQFRGRGSLSVALGSDSKIGIGTARAEDETARLLRQAGEGKGIQTKREGGIVGGTLDFLFGKKTSTPSAAPSLTPTSSLSPTKSAANIEFQPPTKSAANIEFQPPTKSAANIEFQLPDASLQEEGDKIQDEETGRSWEVVNGDWVEQ